MGTIELRSARPVLWPRVAKPTAVWHTTRQKQRDEHELTFREIDPIACLWHVSLNNHTAFDP